MDDSTVWDFYAGAALSAMAGSAARTATYGVLAEGAAKLADALILEREKRFPEKPVDK